MLEGLFRNVTESEKNDAIAAIIEHATPRQDFFLMLVLSIAMAAFGVLLQSTVILIGSMLIAPLLYPLLSLALGVIVADENLIGRSVYTLGKSVALGLAAAFIIGLLFAPGSTTPFPFGTADMPSSLMYAVVAVIAGLAAAFAVTKPHLNDTLPGVAISVALVPPLAAAGVALSSFEWPMFSGSLLLFLVNVIGIVFSAMIVFALMRFAVKQKVAKQAVKEGERVVAEESQSATPAA